MFVSVTKGSLRFFLFVCRDVDQPFTAPMVMPLAKYFWKKG